MSEPNAPEGPAPAGFPSEGPASDGLSSAGASPARKARGGLPMPVVMILVAATCLAVLAGTFAFWRGRRVELPVLAEVPAFAMKNQAGQAVSPAELRGQPFIVDFIFLSCRTSCPKLTARMKDLHDRIVAQRSTIRLVSITAAPENDDVPALARYADGLHIDGKVWSFLTGPLDQLEPVVVKGFKIQYEKVKTIDPAANMISIMHGDWFVLVDGKGRIRGYYDSHEKSRLDDLLLDAKILARYPDR